ncbi:hypothetical protein NDU88_009030 [Pleurodeles waltl]|uniref:Uncharacterized protein n=1 Tax=Pleurodeles waltl TaxID=8319 RepID=A0AAV7QTH9_PLEWA|nr:hypothetical protein NDU88_009030 [Pleurodeles waltl]
MGTHATATAKPSHMAHPRATLNPPETCQASPGPNQPAMGPLTKSGREAPRSQKMHSQPPAGGTISTSCSSPPRAAGKPLAPPVQVVFAAEGPISCHIVLKAREMCKRGRSEHPSSAHHRRAAGATRQPGLPIKRAERLQSDPTAEQASREGAYLSPPTPVAQ